MTPSNLAGLLSEILDLCVSTLGSRCPDRAYISAGQIAVDCEQLVVTWGTNGIQTTGTSLFPGSGISSAKTAGIPITDVQVMVTRVVPSLQGDLLPDPDDLADAAGEILADAEILWCALSDAAAKGPLGPCRLAAVRQAQPYGPSGGFGGVQIGLTVQYSCVPPSGS